jgi:hypothetical protein
MVPKEGYGEVYLAGSAGLAFLEGPECPPKFPFSTKAHTNENRTCR